MDNPHLLPVPLDVNLTPFGIVTKDIVAGDRSLVPVFDLAQDSVEIVEHRLNWRAGSGGMKGFPVRGWNRIRAKVEPKFPKF